MVSSARFLKKIDKFLEFKEKSEVLLDKIKIFVRKVWKCTEKSKFVVNVLTE